MDKQQLIKGWACCGVVLGAVGALAPSRLQNGYGIANNSDTRALMRPLGTRTLLLGAISLGAKDSEIDRLLLPLAIMNGADAALDVLGAVVDGIPRRAAALGAAISGMQAALLVYARSLK